MIISDCNPALGFDLIPVLYSNASPDADFGFPLDVAAFLLIRHQRVNGGHRPSLLATPKEFTGASPAS
ncbi:hypothetical protein EVAR_79514_1 [Eumeta japonica]|uniref:Uncharacterized protein n=1 Tax=Eumeta variegata TaxID=151549 RepID=A0A4C1UDQ1_EUMVA|nr:hypothetical protein EVAR_79514_1 [Eumeta japonica]